MQKRPTIAHIIPGLEIGGAERSLSTLLTSGLENEFRSHVISLRGPGHYGSRLQDAGIPVTCLRMHERMLSGLSLRRVLQNLSPDIVQGWMYHGNLLALLASYLSIAKPRVAWNIRLSQDAPELICRRTRIICKGCATLSRLPAQIIYNSQRGRERHEVLGYLPDRATVIPNGFDLCRWKHTISRRQTARRVFGLDSGSFVIGFVGRRHPQKDLPNLLQAFSMLSAEYPQSALVGIGRDLDKEIPAGMDQSRIRLLGERNDVEELLPGFDIFVLPSKDEGFPNVVGEAMSSELPCVVTDVGDSASIVGTTGWVVPPRNPEALLASLREAARCSPVTLTSRGKAARERIRTEYSLHAVLTKYRQLYIELLGT